jgi:hypothetical protein
VCLSKELAGAYFDYGKAMNHLQKMLHHLRCSCRWRSQLGNISWTVARDPVRSVTHGSVWEVGGDPLIAKGKAGSAFVGATLVEVQLIRSDLLLSC